MARSRQFVVLALLLGSVHVSGQAQLSSRQPKFDPVQWSLELDPASVSPGQRVVGLLKAEIESGWHLYSPTTPAGGPIPTKIELAESPSVESWKLFQAQPNRRMDDNFNLETETYEDEAVFQFDIHLAEDVPPGSKELEAKVRYQVCDDRLCLPPVRKTATASLTIDRAALAAAPAIPDHYVEAIRKSGSGSSQAAVSGTARTDPARSLQSEGIIQFAGIAFGFGLLAIFTPCVFPMIPITMSYFVSTQAGSKRPSFVQATIFCVGVVVLFTGLGTIVSAALGPFGLLQLGSNVWINLFIALVFIAFGASLLGAFEITVPSSLVTKLDRVAGRGGTVGTLVMGLVFALASFACTGPFVGALLAGSIQGDVSWPIFGMLMFSVGLALPFFFLALFPAYLSRLPKSGGWLARTKATMAFVILAAAVKYLSNVDQMYQWHILTRDRFLALWIVLFALAGLYLLGLVRLAGDEDSSIGVGRLAIGGLFLVMAVSLIPGMFGVRLGEIDAYVPPPEYSGLTSAGFGSGGSETAWLKNDYQGALQIAREEGKAVLVSFTGYACTNCHWMKANMFTKPEIAGALDGLVLVELYTDGVDDASLANQKLQLDRFGTVAIPYYAIVRPDETIVAEFPGRTRDVEEFRRFLNPRMLAQAG